MDLSEMPVCLPDDDVYYNLARFDRTIITTDNAVRRDVRELHIGLINMMPDAALKATERQFLLPLHYAASGMYIMPHLISLEGVERGADARSYINKNYITFDQAKDQGLDALIITGANISDPDLTQASFYGPLQDVINYAEGDAGPTSTLYSCLATHAYMNIRHGVVRQPVTDSDGKAQKMWGVFEHAVRDEAHPLTHGMDTVFDVPHSRWNQITAEQFSDAGMRILIDSKEAGVFMSTSADGLRAVLFQGHPEYDTVSLMKEWKRDVGEFAKARSSSDRSVDSLPVPRHYFDGEGLRLAETFNQAVINDPNHSGQLTTELETQILAATQNRWRSSARALFSNWVAAVLDKTHVDRHKPFMEGVDPDNVFGLSGQVPS